MVQTLRTWRLRHDPHRTDRQRFYNLSTSAIDTSALETAFPGADMSRSLRCDHYEQLRQRRGGNAGALPVSFTVTATYNGQTVSVDTFSAYIDRVIEVTKEQAAQNHHGGGGQRRRQRPPCADERD
jgi:hypothetical protein